jgi:NADPH2:quinone reductase
MKAITVKQYGGPEQLVMQDLPIPEPTAGQVLIKIKAFGLNRAELYMRQGAWGDVAPVLGIECVGEVVADSSHQWDQGQKVAAMMGGMGRTINGSYAEYVCVPATNVVPIQSSLPWAQLAALPESYATAWTCVHRNLSVLPGQTLLVRGGSSALGQAAVNIAAEIGVNVITTTRSRDKASVLTALGARTVLIDDSQLSKQVRSLYPLGIDAVLDIVGTTTLLDSLAAARREGRVCMAGFLGGNEAIESFNPLQHLPSSVSLSFFASFMFGTPGFPLSDVPLNTLIDRAATGVYRANPSHVFALENVPDAHRLMEANQAKGKAVVVL